MAAPLSLSQKNELEGLSHQYGPVLYREAEIFTGFHDPVLKTDRVGEVCMVIRRPNGKLLLSIKSIYPRGAHRLPTGGVGIGEPIFAALFRETQEETGLSVRLRRFLALISYRLARTSETNSSSAREDERRLAERSDHHVADEREPVFHTFAFLLDEAGGTLGVQDPTELIEEYIEIDPPELTTVAERLESLPESDRGSVGSWRDWGKFRAVVHRAVHEALTA